MPQNTLNNQATSPRNVWHFQNIVSRRLLAWAIVNIAAGIWMQQRKSDLARGIGSQSTSWGAINALIAIGGTIAAQIRQTNDNAYNPETLRREQRNLFRALWINGVLDIFYMLGGILLARTRGKTNEKLRGMGWGIVVQGGFLFIFDFVHAGILSADKDQSA